MKDNHLSSKLKNNLFYLWEDFKWPLIAAVVVLFVAVYSLAAAFGKKETVISVMLIDCYADASPEKMESDFLTFLDCDPGKQQAEFTTSLLFSDTDSGSYTMTSLSRFLADIGSEKLDICGMREEDFIKYDNSETWMDLSHLLSADTLSALEASLLRKDGRVIGIYADALPAMAEYGCYGDGSDRGVLGVIYNAPHRSAAAGYFDFALGVA